MAAQIHLKRLKTSLKSHVQFLVAAEQMYLVPSFQISVGSELLSEAWDIGLQMAGRPQRWAAAVGQIAAAAVDRRQQEAAAGNGVL